MVNVMRRKVFAAKEFVYAISTLDHVLTYAVWGRSESEGMECEKKGCCLFQLLNNLELGHLLALEAIDRIKG